MGQLIVQIAGITGQLSFDDAKGQVIVNNYIAAYGGPAGGTNQEKMDWFISHLAMHVRAVHVAYARDQAIETARDNAISGAEDWT